MFVSQQTLVKAILFPYQREMLLSKPIIFAEFPLALLSLSYLSMLFLLDSLVILQLLNISLGFKNNLAVVMPYIVLEMLLSIMLITALQSTSVHWI